MFDTVTIEPHGRIQDSVLGGGGGGGGGVFLQYLKHKIFSCEHRRREAVMNLTHFHTPKITLIYTQGRSNEFASLRVNVSVFDSQNA